MAGRHPEHRVPNPVMLLVSRFPETNLRTYVIGPEGQGMWLFSVEADTVVTSLGARLLFGAPYFLADMSVDTADPGKLVYESRRRRPLLPASHRLVVAPGAVLAEDDPDRTEVDDLLTGRWRASTKLAGAPAYGAVEHQVWPLQRAEAVEVEQDLTDAAGLGLGHGRGGELGPPHLVHFSPGVDVRLSRPHRSIPSPDGLSRLRGRAKG